MLSDHGIRLAIRNKGVVIEVAPEFAGRYSMLDEALYQPNSIDVRLGKVTPEPGFVHAVQDVNGRKGWRIEPEVFALGSILEVVRVSDQIAAFVHGKSSWGRVGLKVQNAGLVDAGFEGGITLELKNEHHFKSVTLWEGQRIAQLVFQRLETPADRPYGFMGAGNHYQGQPAEPTPARGIEDL